MAYWNVKMVLCLLFFANMGLSAHLKSYGIFKESQSQFLSSEVENAFNSNGTIGRDIVPDEDIKEPDNCQCKNGLCEKKEGKLVCTCPPEYGVYNFFGTVECRPCNCGKESNCTIDASWLKDTINCICKEGYRVENRVCQKSDECLVENGGCQQVCTFDGENAICSCNPAYEIDTRDPKKCKKKHVCDTQNPCKNGGLCYERGRDYMCDCEEGLTGKNCTESRWCVENRKKICGNLPCTYDAIRNISYCHCDHALLFNVNSKKCEPCYCGNHGTCLSNDGMKTCECEENYIEKDGICYDPCDPNPCWNFGNCTAKKNGNYNCSCEYPYTGKICEKQFEIVTTSSETPVSTVTQPECDCGSKSSGCEYGFRGRKRCFCLPGYSQKGDKCSGTCFGNADCFNGGACRMEDGYYFCRCLPNFTGDKCEVNSACERLQYKCEAMRGVCRVTSSGAVCDCPPEKAYKWHSGVCEDICDSSKCKYGKCEIVGKSFKCICDYGFTGYSCDEKIRSKDGDEPITKNDLPGYLIGFIISCAVVLLLTIGILYLTCRIKKLSNAK